MAAGMTPLRAATDFITGLPIDRTTRRARLLAARRKPIGSIPVEAFFPATGTRGTSSARSGAAAAASAPTDPKIARRSPAERASGATGHNASCD